MIVSLSSEKMKIERNCIVTSHENYAKVDAMFVICSSEMMDPRPKRFLVPVLRVGEIFRACDKKSLSLT
jgi:hypothetical protein